MLELEERLDCTYKFSRMEMLTPFTSADNPELSETPSSTSLLDRLSSPSKSSPIMASSYTRTAISYCRFVAEHCLIRAKLMTFGRSKIK